MNELIENPAPNHPRLKVIVGIILISVILAALITYFTSIYFTKLQLVFGELFLIIPAIFYLRIKKYSFQEVFRIKRVGKNVILASVVLGVSLPVLNDEIDRIISSFIKMPPEFEELLAGLLTANSIFEWITLILAAVILAGIIEEMLFRGLLQQALERKFDLPYAIFLAALVFAMVHPAAWFIQVLIIGCVFGYFAWRSKSILPAIILHILNNGFSLLLNNVSGEELGWYNWNDHVNPPILAVAACVTFYAIKWFYNLTEADMSKS